MLTQKLPEDQSLFPPQQESMQKKYAEIEEELAQIYLLVQCIFVCLSF